MNDIQKCILLIFNEVKKVCEANKIPYYAIGGTCIGAIRHNGFIPWDDDLDIAIPIEKMDSFIKCAESELPSYLHIYKGSDVLHYHYFFLKIIDTRTTFLELTEINYPDAYKGVFIDIMPLCGVPGNLRKRNDFVKKQSILFKLNNLIRFGFHPWTDCSNFSLRLFRLIRKFVPYDYFYNIWIRNMRKYPLSSADFTGYVWSERLPLLIFPISYFSDIQMFPFEDTTIACPIGYDKYLTQHFGDYMKLPPDSQKTGHFVGLIDLKKSYKDFQKNPELVIKYIKGGY